MKARSILFIGGSIDEGGAGKMLKYVANVSTGIFECVTIMSTEQKSRPSSINDDIRFVSCSVKRPFDLKWRIQIIRGIRKQVKIISPDIICSFTSEVAFMSRISTLGLTVVFTSAERGAPHTWNFMWKNIMRLTYELSDYCFFQLDRARDFFNKRIRQKSFVIPNPFVLKSDVSPYFGERKKTIIGAGRFVPEKGFDVLIDAYYIVAQKHPDYKLVIYGKGPLQEKYEQQLKQYGLLDKTEFPGYVSNVAETVREEGVFVLPSRLEGIPNVLLEAMSVGIPTVSANCEPGGPMFLSDKGERGLIVPMDDPQSLAEAIIKIIEDQSLSSKFQKNGPQVRELFNPSIISREWVDAFTSIIKQQC